MPSDSRDPKDLIFWKREERRWAEALEAGYVAIAGELYEAQFPKDKYLRKSAKLREIFVLSQALFRFIVPEKIRLFEEVDGRQRWDRYLTALHYLLPRFSRGWVVRSVMGLMRLGGAGERLASWAVELSEVVRRLHSTFQEVGRYIASWETGEMLMRRFSNEALKEPVALYASYKTFTDDSRFEAFHAALRETSGQVITVVIEDGIKLFLMIAEDFAEIVVRLPLLERPEEFENNDSDRQIVEEDLKLLVKTLAGYLRDSEHLDLFSRLWRKTAEQAVKSWYEEERALRAQHPQEVRRRYIEQFEQGLIL